MRQAAAALRYADGVGAFSSGGVRSARHVLVWDAVSRSGAFPALSEVSESLGSDRTRPRALAQASTGRDPGASESSESLYPGHACLGPPEGPARVIRAPERPARPGASESQDSVGKAAARGTAGRCAGSTHRIRRDAEAVRPGWPAGASPRAGVWAQN